jgi:trk system potassium uptake protein TrkH
MLVFFILVMVLLATGLDFLTAFSSSLAMLNNLGPGLGSVAANYSDVSESAKWIMCLAMLLGRLEIFTLLVLFTPAFWRK